MEIGNGKATRLLQVVKSPAQLENQKKFAKAVKISKAVKNDPQRSKDYSEKKKKMKYRDVYHAAMSDCLTKPKVQKVDLNNYRGQQGNVIRISAWDKFRVETVNVMILNNKGQLIEKGTAVSRMFSGNREWDYTATVENVDYQGGTIEIGSLIDLGMLFTALFLMALRDPDPTPSPSPRREGVIGGEFSNRFL